jgi:hypothetical protein
MNRLANLPCSANTRWVFYLGADHRGLEEQIESLRWPSMPALLHARPLNRSVTTVWNSLYEAWVGA